MRRCSYCEMLTNFALGYLINQSGYNLHINLKGHGKTESNIEI